MNFMIRKNYFRYSPFAVLLAAVMLIADSCVETTVVGSDLLNQDLQIVGFTDTFRIRAVTTREDSVLTHSADAGEQIIRHPVGNLDDPFFGKSSSIVSTGVFLNGVGSIIVDSTYRIDSVIVALVYTNTASYGNLDVPITFDTYMLDADLDATRDYYSSEEIPRRMEASGSKAGFVPALTDSVTIIRPGDTFDLKPQLRIRMSDDFVSEMRQQPPETFESQDSLELWWKGLQFEISDGANTMLGFNLNDGQSGVFVYYSRLDSVIADDFQFLFFNPSFFDVAQVQHAQYIHDYSGSEVQKFIDSEELTDSLIFVQSMSGVNAAVRIEDVDNLADFSINKAVLELYGRQLQGDDLEVYQEIERIQTRTFDADSNLVNSRDVRLALGIQNIDSFGGRLEELEDGLFRYQMTVTATVQDIVRGRERNLIFVSSSLKPNQANRIILFEPGHPEYPARLKIAFTRTQ